MTGEGWVVVCPVYSWESEPLSKDDAEELLDFDTSIHPFEGTCRSSHYTVRYQG